MGEYASATGSTSLGCATDEKCELAVRTAGVISIDSADGGPSPGAPSHSDEPATGHVVQSSGTIPKVEVADNIKTHPWEGIRADGQRVGGMWEAPPSSVENDSPSQVAEDSVHGSEDADLAGASVGNGMDDDSVGDDDERCSDEDNMSVRSDLSGDSGSIAPPSAGSLENSAMLSSTRVGAKTNESTMATLRTRARGSIAESIANHVCTQLRSTVGFECSADEMRAFTHGLRTISALRLSLLDPIAFVSARGAEDLAVVIPVARVNEIMHAVEEAVSEIAGRPLKLFRRNAHGKRKRLNKSAANVFWALGRSVARQLRKGAMGKGGAFSAGLFSAAESAPGSAMKPPSEALEEARAALARPLPSWTARGKGRAVRAAATASASATSSLAADGRLRQGETSGTAGNLVARSEKKLQRGMWPSGAIPEEKSALTDASWRKINDEIAWVGHPLFEDSARGLCYYRCFRKNGEVIGVGDAVHMQSPPEEREPYIGRVTRLYEDMRTGDKFCLCRWYYRRTDVQPQLRGKLPDVIAREDSSEPEFLRCEVFDSNHLDQNLLISVLSKCCVVHVEATVMRRTVRATEVLDEDCGVFAELAQRRPTYLCRFRFLSAKGELEPCAPRIACECAISGVDERKVLQDKRAAVDRKAQVVIPEFRERSRALTSDDDLPEDERRLLGTCLWQPSAARSDVASKFLALATPLLPKDVASNEDELLSVLYVEARCDVDAALERVQSAVARKGFVARTFSSAVARRLTSGSMCLVADEKCPVIGRWRFAAAAPHSSKHSARAGPGASNGKTGRSPKRRAPSQGGSSQKARSHSGGKVPSTGAAQYNRTASAFAPPRSSTGVPRTAVPAGILYGAQLAGVGSSGEYVAVQGQELTGEESANVQSQPLGPAHALAFAQAQSARVQQQELLAQHQQQHQQQQQQQQQELLAQQQEFMAQQQFQQQLQQQYAMQAYLAYQAQQSMGNVPVSSMAAPQQIRAAAMLAAYPGMNSAASSAGAFGGAVSFPYGSGVGYMPGMYSSMGNVMVYPSAAQPGTAAAPSQQFGQWDVAGAPYVHGPFGTTGSSPANANLYSGLPSGNS